MEYYIPISRRIFEHPFWCEDRVFSRFEAWLDIVQSARFEDTKQLIGNRFIEVKRGQMLVSLRFLAGRWQWSTKKVNSFLDLLIQDKMIIKETPKETGQTVITICNYDKYNFISQELETEKKQQGNTKETARKQQGNKINKDNKENKLKEDNIPPTPPKGEGVNSKARLLFENYFRETFSDSYYWTAKDAGAMSQLLNKLKFQRKQKKMDVSDDSLLYALQYLLSSVKEGWIFENFSVTNINSKFNEIVAQAKKSTSSKSATDIGVVLKNNSPDKYDNDSDKWNR
jgi:hypothetical protein|nr:MAG TPA: replisome organizer [Caudoviricetes sp.]